MQLYISGKKKEGIFKTLSKANLKFQKIYPGDSTNRQPVHTVYGGAHLFKATTAATLGRMALENMLTNAPNFATFSTALELPGHDTLPKTKRAIDALIKRLDALPLEDRRLHPAGLAYEVYGKVIEKLKREAVEDFRIDFEDGFGNRTDEEEDETAVRAAKEVAKGIKEKSLPPFIGIRIKPFTEDLKERSVRTLDIFLGTLLKKSKGKLPKNFIVMLPKVTIPEQIEALIEFFELLEKVHGLKKGKLRMEIMVEQTQAILDKDGINPLRKYILAAKGRMRATHFGTYDYTASCNITAKYQTMDHPVCDFAHHVTKVALGHTGIELSDGATNVMPVGPHKGEDLSAIKLKENRMVVHQAWKQAYDHIRHSLWNGFYQGWDLHPSQLPIRYAAVYTFFLESYADAAERLTAFVGKAAQASLTGDIFDDAATGQGLLNYFLRALNSGAITVEEALATGLTLEEIQSRSFLKILEGRRAAAE